VEGFTVGLLQGYHVDWANQPDAGASLHEQYITRVIAEEAWGPEQAAMVAATAAADRNGYNADPVDENRPRASVFSRLQ
jgi:hypothetical protein